MIKDEYLQSVVQINCIPVLIIVFLFFFLQVNYTYEKELTKKFLPSVLLLLLLIIVDNFDYYCYDAILFEGVGGLIHRAASMLGYDVRILLMSRLIAIAASRIMSSVKNIELKISLPAMINVVLLLPCLFTDLFFFYREDGSIGRGIFAYEPHLLSAVYIFFLFFLSYKCRKIGKTGEMGILAICGIVTVLSVLAEFLFALRGILDGVVALDITFYYLYLHIEHFRFDSLTGIFNRDAFIADVEKYDHGEISHLLSIDLNDLKKLNDTYGHAEGDKALKTIASVIKASCIPNSFAYRVGGDEFAGICLGKDGGEVTEMVSAIYSGVEEAGYSCAVGFAEWKKGMTFTEVYKEADDRMYRKKCAMKHPDK